MLPARFPRRRAAACGATGLVLTGVAGFLLLLCHPARAQTNSAVAMSLPFTTGFRGPVYSFAAGSLLLVGLTAAGEILAAEK